MSEAATQLGPRITSGQRTALFAAGRDKGMDIDDIRALTPLGSISALSRDEAAALLQRLNAGTGYAHPRKPTRGPRRPKGVFAFVTDAQRGKIEALRINLGWTVEGLAAFLSERHYAADPARAMSAMKSTADGRDVIELLKGVLERMQSAAAASIESATPQPNASGAPTNAAFVGAAGRPVHSCAAQAQCAAGEGMDGRRDTEPLSTPFQSAVEGGSNAV